MQVKLSKLPDAKKTYTVDFPKLAGGLNLRELDYRLPANQTPEMKNMWWQNGVLQCRDGQEYISDDDTLGAGYTCFKDLFWGNAFFHIGTKIYYANPNAVTFTLTELQSNVPQIRGTFFRYNDCLYYKTTGAFLRIKYQTTSPYFVCESVYSNAFIPTIVMNASPDNGGGSSYQPENRLSSSKKVLYNAKAVEAKTTATGDGSTMTFSLGYSSATDLQYVSYVYSESDLVSSAIYTVNLSAGTITFTVAPSTGAKLTFVMGIAVTAYHLPVENVDSVTSVKVSGETKTVGTDYTVNLTTGVITFATGHAPAVTFPATNNTVEVIYVKANADALKAINDCTYAMVSGEGKSLCVLLAGCEKQPNAVFWNSNDEIGMNDTYWPMSYYNLVGDTEDPVTGFGQQYDDTIVFQTHSVGKLNYGVESVDDRDSISFTYERVNSNIGCDLPWSIQLVENNLVFCNTYKGVQMLRSSSSAYENNVESISKNVDGDETTKGLKHDVQSGDTVSSFDDGNRYWLCTGGHVYAWDYEISTYSDPSWFYFDSIYGVAFFQDDEEGKYHLDAEGCITKFERTFADYGGAIEKVYQFPPQHFDTYNRLKDISYVLFTTRSDTDSTIDITYQCDYGEWTDQTPIRAYSWHLSPRNLTRRFLGVLVYAAVAKRKPGLRHVRHFGMRLSNNLTGDDLSIVSAQIYYKYSGEER